MTSTARGTFTVTMQPGAPEVGGAVARFDLSKAFTGDLVGAGEGLMLSGGDPMAGEAGYVAIEVVRGRLEGREGAFLLQQLGSMHAGDLQLRYEVVPGSGSGALAGITGDLQLDVVDGVHHYELRYDLQPTPPAPPVG